MTRHRGPRATVQERGLLLLVAIALAGAGVALFLGTDDVSDPVIAAPVTLNDVTIIVPSFSDGSTQIDINTASEEELTGLQGIGPVLAERIVAYRDEHGPFGTVDDLTAVRGIGDATVEGFRDRATAGPSD